MGSNTVQDLELSPADVQKQDISAIIWLLNLHKLQNQCQRVKSNLKYRKSVQTLRAFFHKKGIQRRMLIEGLVEQWKNFEEFQMVKCVDDSLKRGIVSRFHSYRYKQHCMVMRSEVGMAKLQSLWMGKDVNKYMCMWRPFNLTPETVNITSLLIFAKECSIQRQEFCSPASHASSTQSGSDTELALSESSQGSSPSESKGCSLEAGTRNLSHEHLQWLGETSPTEQQKLVVNWLSTQAQPSIDALSTGETHPSSSPQPTRTLAEFPSSADGGVEARGSVDSGSYCISHEPRSSAESPISESRAGFVLEPTFKYAEIALAEDCKPESKTTKPKFQMRSGRKKKATSSLLLPEQLQAKSMVPMVGSPKNQESKVKEICFDAVDADAETGSNVEVGGSPRKHRSRFQEIFFRISDTNSPSSKYRQVCLKTSEMNFYANFANEMKVQGLPFELPVSFHKAKPGTIRNTLKLSKREETSSISRFVRKMRTRMAVDERGLGN